MKNASRKGCWNLRLPALWAAALALAAAGPAWAGEEAIERVAFGSCCREDEDMRIWSAVAATRPQLLLLLGDNIYADTQDMSLMRAKYRKLGANRGFRELRSRCPVLATWDDHDYGANDAGREYPMKTESKRIFEEFFEVPADAPERLRPGIYSSRCFGPPGSRLQVILLDLRSFRSPLEKNPDYSSGGQMYFPSSGPDATMLGEDQWAWLENQLGIEADLRLIGSSIQAVPEEHRWEKWANFPEERKRLLALLENKGGNVLLLSGDRHLAEISRLSPDRPGAAPILEITSSGLTHAGGGADSEPNRHRVGPGNYRGLNFGTITIDWKKRVAALKVHDVAGDVVLEEPYDFSSKSD